MLPMMFLFGPPPGRVGVEKPCSFFALKDRLGLETLVVIPD